MKKKDMKSLDLFKKGFRKNEIVIYAIALMLVTAGYFNYSANLERTQETATENIIVEKENTTTVSKTEEDKDEDIGDAKLVNSDNVVKEEKNEEDYYTSTKLQRDTNYADMISTYTNILKDNSIVETQKAIAMKEIKKITDTKNAISVCENILSTKDLKNYVVLVNENSVNVIVKNDGELKKNKIAQIQNIVSRELNCKIEDIHITQK